MKRIEKFGSLSANQKLNFFKNELGNEEALLFQYYETGNNDNVTQEDIDETFEYYCDDMIYYYNSDVKSKIEKKILKELVKETIQMEKETQKSETEEKVRRLEEQVLFLTEKTESKKYHRPDDFQTEQFKVLSEIRASHEQENILSDSVENIIEQIAQKTELQQKQPSQPINKMTEEEMVISAEQEIKTAVQNAIKTAVAITKEEKKP